MPGSYPGSRNPAHIHAVIKLPGKKARWIDDFLFDGDPFVTSDLQSISARQGKFANVMKVTREKGRLTAQRDIKINEMR
jgi:protocatechuate 3,4-dioxygenase beta subunit